MGKTLKLIISLSFQLILFLVVSGSKSTEHGLTVKLIHRDLPESPFHQPHLTQNQRTKNLILQTLARHSSFTTNGLRTRTEFLPHNLVLMAQVGIGTIPPHYSGISYFLQIDTSSSLSWTQCEECRFAGRNCFNQTAQLFPVSRSRSYRNLPCGQHPLCYPDKCLHGYCSYKINYDTHGTSEGYLASETLTFGSKAVRNLVIGCGFDQRNMNVEHTGGSMAGVLALGWGRRSLLSQLGLRAQGRFSYCLKSSIGDRNATSYLRFGSDIIPLRLGMRSVDLKQIGLFDAYFVELVGISVAGLRLDIPPVVFSPRLQTPRGVIIDSGSAFTVLVEPAYEVVERAVQHHLESTIPGLIRHRITNTFRLCYERSNEGNTFTDLPRMTFHFAGGVDMVVQPQGVFHYITGGVLHFCLAVLPTNHDTSNGGISLIGVYQQTNHRFIFDVSGKKLYFGAEDCSREG